MKWVRYYDYPIGRVAIACDEYGITDVTTGGVADAEESETPLIKTAAKQLEEYFYGVRREFDLPLSLCGTEFQKKVWSALLNIPYGAVCSYGDIAKEIGNPKACRAVGGANNKNRIIIIIPCHRVIGADGSLVGYGGGLDVKEKLLTLERNFLEKNVAD